MPVTHSPQDSSLDRANEMYWAGDRTVEEIVKELKISRSALYSAVRPQDAATSCPECGEAMVFTNRSNREAHAATCSACAIEAPAAQHPAPPPSRAPTDHDPTPRPPRAWTQWRGDLAAVPRERVAMVGGAAVLGVMVGAMAGRMLREML